MSVPFCTILSTFEKGKKMKRIKKFVKKYIVQTYKIRELLKKYQSWKRKKYYKKYCLPQEVDEKLVIFESFLGKQQACSPKAIYEAMKQDSRFDDFRFIWVMRNAAEKRTIIGDERTMVVPYNKRRCFRCYGKAKYWVTNWRLSDAIIKKDNQVCIQTWHGTPLKKIGMDLKIEGNATTDQKKAHEMYLNDAKMYDYFVSPSAFCTEVFTTAFGLDRLDKKEILIETGYPRNDYLYKFTDDDVKKIKREIGVTEGKKVIMYAPTWRDNQHQLRVGYTFDPAKHIKNFIDNISDEYVVLLRLHYLIANEIDTSQYNGKVINCSEYDDINHLYVISDMLVTDYSSVSFDYANLRRPIVFYMYDLEEYQNTVRDFYFDLDELPGPIVKTQEELFDSIVNIERTIDDYKEKYERFNAKFNYLDDGNAGLRVAEICMK